MTSFKRRKLTKLEAIKENEYNKVHTLKDFWDTNVKIVDCEGQEKVLFSQILESANRSVRYINKFWQGMKVTLHAWKSALWRWIH